MRIKNNEGTQDTKVIMDTGSKSIDGVNSETEVMVSTTSLDDTNLKSTVPLCIEVSDNKETSHDIAKHNCNDPKNN